MENINKRPLHPSTNVRKAITAIQNNEILPITKIGEFYYRFGLKELDLGSIIYTKFTLQGDAIESYIARYGSYHTLTQIIKNPIPKSKLDSPYHTYIPENIEEYLVIGKIIKGYE